MTYNAVLTFKQAKRPDFGKHIAFVTRSKTITVRGDIRL